MAEKDHYKFGIAKKPRQSLAQLFRDIHKIESQVALLRLDLQAAGVLSKTSIKVIDEVPGTAALKILGEPK